MTQFNIYYGTIGKTLGVRYRCTKSFQNEASAKKYAKQATEAFYIRNEGKYGLPSYIQINQESKITGVSIEDLYKDHINDMCRYYVIPTSLDTVKRLKFE